MMRIPSMSFLRWQSVAISEQFDKAAALNIKSTNGKKLIHSSDDPVLAQNIKSVKSYLTQLEGFKKNLDLVKARVNQKSGIMAESIDLMHKTKEILIKAENDTYDNNNRKAMALELESILERQLFLANSQDFNGDYLYSGFNTKTPPFQKINDKITYCGTQDGVQIDIGLNVRAAYAEPGHQVFSQMPSGGNLFEILSTAIDILKTPINSEEDKTAYHAALNQQSGALSSATSDLIFYQSVVANQAVLLYNQGTLYDNLIENNQTYKKQLSNADLAEVLGNYTRQMTIMELTQQTYVKLQETFLAMLTNK